jgi:hypothetical protein
MRKIFWLVVALFFMNWGQAFADTFDFSFNGAGMSVDGTLDAIANADGSFTAISGSGTADGVAITLHPGSGTISNTFVYDNLLFPNAGPSQGLLSNEGGLLFTAPSTPSSGLPGNNVPTWINIYWNVDSGWPGANGTGPYTYYEGFNGGYVPGTSVNGTFTASAVPAPSSLLLLGPCLLGLVGLRKRFRM